MEDDHQDLPEPIAIHNFKGNLTLRTTPEKHREIALRAAESGVSINQYILSKIS
jgi:predicted HicB family RNase H-like nuclease